MRWGRFLLVAGLSVSVLHAQPPLLDMSPEHFLGGPVQPPFLTLLGIVAPGAIATDPEAPLAGHPLHAVYEELRARSASGPPFTEVAYSIGISYDESGRPTEEVRTENKTTSTTVTKYEGAHIVRRESKPSRTDLPVSFDSWKYDASGRLTDYQRGRGNVPDNHFTNFKYDAQGRLTGFEYHQGPGDPLQSRTEYQYSPDGKTIDRSQFDQDGALLLSVSETLNDRSLAGKAIVIERDWQTKKPGAPVTAEFAYDSQGRVTAQTTDRKETKSGGGGEFELPPGTVSFAYDDTKHSRTISYTENGVNLRFTSVFDSAGRIIGQAVESPGPVVDMKLECTNDDHGNWTECRRVVNTARGREVTAAWRRKIEYR